MAINVANAVKDSLPDNYMGGPLDNYQPIKADKVMAALPLFRNSLRISTYLARAKDEVSSAVKAYLGHDDHAMSKDEAETAKNMVKGAFAQTMSQYLGEKKVGKRMLKYLTTAFARAEDYINKAFREGKKVNERDIEQAIGYTHLFAKQQLMAAEVYAPLNEEKDLGIAQELASLMKAYEGNTMQLGNDINEIKSLKNYEDAVSELQDIDRSLDATVQMVERNRGINARDRVLPFSQGRYDGGDQVIREQAVRNFLEAMRQREVDLPQVSPAASLPQLPPPGPALEDVVERAA